MAAGLRAKMFSFDFIATLEICVTIFEVLAPTTTMLQGTIIDFGSASSILAYTTKALKELRTNESWTKLQEKTSELCSEYGIERKRKRLIRKKRFFGEYGLDYHEHDEVTRLKVDVYYTMIDSLLTQINERFEKDTLEIMKEMGIFCHVNLLKDDCPTRAEYLCKHYNLNVEAIENELKDFKRIYKLMEKDIDISDISKPTESQLEPPQGDDDDELDQVDIEGVDDDVDETNTKSEETRTFILQGFIKPFRLLVQLMQYKELFVLYKILLTLSVTSCSAERAFSKLKIIKNPIRSSMLDEWMSAMMILASEKDILDSINNEEIINKLAMSSRAYSELLLKK